MTERSWVEKGDRMNVVEGIYWLVGRMGEERLRGGVRGRRGRRRVDEVGISRSLEGVGVVEWIRKWVKNRIWFLGCQLRLIKNGMRFIEDSMRFV